jgi:AcrR family transcriptional regulator
VEAERRGAAGSLGERERIREAVVDLVLERGCEGTTAAMVSERAGIQPGAFERNFADIGECLLDAYLTCAGEFDRRVFDAFEAGETWRDGLRVAAYEAARYVERHPREIRFGAVGLLQAGPVVQAHRANHMQRLVDLVDCGRQELDDPESLGRPAAEGVLGSINELMVKEFHKGVVRSPQGYVPDLMYLAVRPYLGHDVAREELSIPAPPEEGLGGE